MLKQFIALILFLSLTASNLHSQELGTASGKGVIERILPEDKTETVSFEPKFSYAYKDKSGATWLILTESQPPIKDWLNAKESEEARRIWCGKEKSSFAALKLDTNFAVDLYFLCPANGFVNTEMLSTINGLDSIAVKFDERTKSKLKGTLRTGEGNCPTADGIDAYCKPKGDFSFDAPVF